MRLNKFWWFNSVSQCRKKMVWLIDLQQHVLRPASLTLKAGPGPVQDLCGGRSSHADSSHSSGACEPSLRQRSRSNFITPNEAQQPSESLLSISPQLSDMKDEQPEISESSWEISESLQITLQEKRDAISSHCCCYCCRVRITFNCQEHLLWRLFPLFENCLWGFWCVTDRYWIHVLQLDWQNVHFCSQIFHKDVKSVGILISFQKMLCFSHMSFLGVWGLSKLSCVALSEIIGFHHIELILLDTGCVDYKHCQHTIAQSLTTDTSGVFLV